MNYIPTISDNIKILSGQIEEEIDRLNHDHQRDKNQTDSLVYIGNWQDAIPRSIWTDVSLSDIDVRSWGIIRTQAIQGSAVMLSLNTLLKETRGYSNATVSRILYVLRLTRWISLCSTLRSEAGKFKGNIYAIHDSPVTLDDGMYLDREYVSFVKKQTSHSNKFISSLAQSIWKLISQAIEKNNTFLTESISKTANDLNQLVNTEVIQTSISPSYDTHIYKLNTVKNIYVQKLNVDAKHHVQILNVDKKKEESVEKQKDNIHVQILNAVPICSSRSSRSFIKNKEKEKEKTPPTNSEGISRRENIEIEKDLIYPKIFNSNEIHLATMYLKKIESDLQQSFLDETAATIKQRSKTNNPIRNPVGYLAWLCNEHGKGNTYLTSAFLNYQQQRERKETRERKIKKQQQAITEAALTGKEIISVINGFGQDDKSNQSRPEEDSSNRWKGINSEVRVKNQVGPGPRGK